MSRSCLLLEGSYRKQEIVRRGISRIVMFVRTAVAFRSRQCRMMASLRLFSGTCVACDGAFTRCGAHVCCCEIRPPRIHGARALPAGMACDRSEDQDRHVVVRPRRHTCASISARRAI